MRLRGILFARFALDYADHPKIAGLSDAAFRAHVEMILYARKYMTDGRIAKRVAMRFGSDALSELMANDSESPSLALLPDGDYQIYGYADMQETRDEIDKKRQVNAQNGQRGGIAKGQRIAKRTASESLSENVAEIETETERTNTSGKPDTFDAFWEIYPRKEAKGGAVRAYRSALKRAKPDVILAGAQRYRDEPGRTPQFTAMAATWLNADRWADAPKPLLAVNGSRGTPAYVPPANGRPGREGW